MVRVDTLEPLSVGCTWPVYRGLTATGAPVFVKVAERRLIDRTLAFLAAAADCPLLPRPIDAEVPALAGRDVLVLEWRDVARVNAEDMTEAQADSLLAGYKLLSSALACAPDVAAPPPEDDPSYQYGLVADYSRRHRMLGRLLQPLLSIPAADRAYGSRPRVIIHGDLQPKNYGFCGDRLAAVFDFDEITTGLACEDLTYAYAERVRKSSLAPANRRQLAARFRRMCDASPWPAEDWRFAVNHCRLRIAARRLESHPDAAFVAFDVARRDRPLARFLQEVFS